MVLAQIGTLSRLTRPGNTLKPHYLLVGERLAQVGADAVPAVSPAGHDPQDFPRMEQRYGVDQGVSRGTPVERR